MLTFDGGVNNVDILPECLLVGFAKPDPVGPKKPREDPEPSGSVWLVALRYGYGALIGVLVVTGTKMKEEVCCATGLV